MKAYHNRMALVDAGGELLPVVAGIGAAFTVLILVMCLLIILFGLHHRRSKLQMNSLLAKSQLVLLSGVPTKVSQTPPSINACLSHN